MEEEFLRSLQVICTLVSVMILLTGTVLALRKRRRQRPIRGAAPTLLFSVGVFCALFVASVPLAISEGHDVVSAAIVATITTFQAVFFNRDFTGISRQILAITGSHTLLTNLMVLYFAFLHLVSPLLVIGVILSLLKDTSFRLRACFTRGQTIHVFSTLNERTLALAEDIAATPDGRHMLMFTVPYAQARAERLEWVSRAEGIRALFLPTDITLLRVSSKSSLHLYLMADEPDQNMEQALALIARYRTRGDTALYILSERAADELVLDSCDKGMMRVHLINEPHIIVTRILDRYPLLPVQEVGRLHLLIAGGGRIGYEMLKTACWCGQLPDCPLRIQVVDRQADRLRERFAFECPELHNPAPDSNLTISFLQADVASEAFADLLSGSDPITHVLVGLGDDELNLSTAVSIRRMLARQAILAPGSQGIQAPVIVTIMESDTREAIAGTLAERRGGPMAIHAFGSIRDLYRHDNLVNNLLERLGLQVHLCFCGCFEHPAEPEEASTARRPKAKAQRQLSPEAQQAEKAARKAREDREKATLNYWQQAYEHKSSLATALHLKYKMFALLGHLPDMDWGGTPTRDTVDCYARALEDPTAFDRQLQLEHARWNAYLRSEGYRTADACATAYYLPVVGHHKHDLAKLHPCLVPWEELDKVSEFVNRFQCESGLGGSHKDFVRQDEQIVRIGPALLYAALDDVKATRGTRADVSRRLRKRPAEKRSTEKRPDPTCPSLVTADNAQTGLSNTEPGNPFPVAAEIHLEGAPMPYQPHPASTTETMLPPDIVALAETLARNTHEVWSKGRMSEGWQYGPVRDDKLKTHPGLVPYDELSESEKNYDRQTSMETIRLILSLGYEITRKK